MEKFFKRMTIAMSIPLVIALIITTVMTIYQQNIFFEVTRFVRNNPTYRSVLPATFAHGGVIPFYMFFCILGAAATLIIIVIVTKNPKLRAKQSSGVLMLVCYGAVIVIGLIYNGIGGDKLLHRAVLAPNISTLSTVISLFVSPFMFVFFVLFVITVVKFFIGLGKSKKPAAEKKG